MAEAPETVRVLVPRVKVPVPAVIVLPLTLVKVAAPPLVILVVPANCRLLEIMLTSPPVSEISDSSILVPVVNLAKRLVLAPPEVVTLPPAQLASSKRQTVSVRSASSMSGRR